MRFKKTAAVMAALLMMSASALPVSADWEKDKNGTYYTDEDGNKLRGLNEIDGKTYYFDRKGVMQTGWQTIRRKYQCYFRKDGSMITGRAKIGGKSYYFNEKGYLATGNTIIDGKLYDCGDDGVIGEPYKNCMVEIDGKLYYAGSNGSMRKGLQRTSGGNYYYFGANGYSVSITVKENGVTYVLDADEGLISKKEAPADASKINVKCGVYSDTATTLETPRFKNSADGKKFFYKGWIKNIAAHGGCSVRVDMELYNKDGELIDEVRMCTTTVIKVGEEYKFDDWCSVDEPVYSVKFKVTRR